MKAVIEIDMGNAAFEEPDAELARILRGIADRLDKEVEAGLDLRNLALKDYNGNTVGFFQVLDS